MARQGIDELLEAVSELGMTMSRTAAGEVLDERLAYVTAHMRVTDSTARRYLTDEALAGLARTIVFGFVDETPGADLMGAPRTAAVPVRFAGTVFAGLGEDIRILLVERDDLEHTKCPGGTGHPRAKLLRASDPRPGGHHRLLRRASVQMPPALLLRVARLETAADLVEGGLIGYQVDPAESAGLPGAFRRDVQLMRTMAGQEPST